MITYKHRNQGTCSRSTQVTLSDDGVIQAIEIVGGCSGNLKGISQLVTGMKAQDVIARLEGTHCGPRNTSCPDQIAVTLREALAQKGQNA